MVFKRRVFTSPCFLDFVKKIGSEKTKEDIILKYEVGLSDTLERAGFQSIALCPESLKNETHQKKTYELTCQYHLPLLKKALFSGNPCQEPFVYKTLLSLQKFLENTYPCMLIENHLNRTAPKNYQDQWFHPNLINISLLHRKFIKIKEKPGRYFCYLRIKIFGIPLPLIPSKILFHRWAYEQGKRKCHIQSDYPRNTPANKCL
jgi:hypothetical protein